MKIFPLIRFVGAIIWLICILGLLASRAFGQEKCSDRLTFGANCTKRCHCFDNYLCTNTKTSPGCENDPQRRCEDGYKYASYPACDQECDENKFGDNCVKTCNCEPGSKCNNKGSCICANEYFGNSCEIVSLKITTKPTVTKDTCNTFKIESRAFDANIDSKPNGLAYSIGNYYILYTTEVDATKRKIVKNWTAVKIDGKASPTTISYTTPVLNGNAYFAIQVEFVAEGYGNIPGAIGAQTGPLTVTCTSATTKKPTTRLTTKRTTKATTKTVASTTQKPLEPVKEFKQKPTTANQIDLEWDPVASADINNYEIKLDRSSTQYPNAPTFTSRQTTSATSPVNFNNLTPASQYRITITAVYKGDRKSEPKNILVWTRPSPFTTILTKPLLSEPTESTIKVKFNTITGYIGGPLNGFYIAIRAVANRRRRAATALTTLNIPSDATIVFYSETAAPTGTLIIGSGTSLDNVHSNNKLNPSTSYQVYTVVESKVGANPLLSESMNAMEIGKTSATPTTKPATTKKATTTTTTIAPSDNNENTVLIGVLCALIIFIILVIIIILILWFRCRDKIFKRKRFYDDAPKYVPPPTKTMDSIPNTMSHMPIANNPKNDNRPESWSFWSPIDTCFDNRRLIVNPWTRKNPSVPVLHKKSVNSTINENISSSPSVNNAYDYIDVKSSSLGIFPTHSKQHNQVFDRQPGISFEEEYNNLSTLGNQPNHKDTCEVALRPENQSKNRNLELIPYDHNRVELSGSASDNSEYYINASMIDGYFKRKAYIAAQSPFSNETVKDFWMMVYEKNVAQIVMLTKSIEDSTVKCTEYWPEAVGNKMQIGSISVEMLSESIYAKFILRSFKIVQTDVKFETPLTVEQYQFLGWPEHGIPKSTLPFLDFYTTVRSRTRLEDGPILVHCGTGVSRTAVFIALDSLLQQVNCENSLNVYRRVSKMRRSRPHMIRNPRQYYFIYDLLFDAMISGQFPVSLNLNASRAILKDVNPITKKPFIWEQFQLLNFYSPLFPHDATQLKSALSPINFQKNRFGEILPTDEYRVTILAPGNDDAGSNYINAVWLSNFFMEKDVILTQTPLPNTMADFWEVVVQERITLILDMEAEVYEKRNIPAYWPNAHQRSLSFGRFQVHAIDKSIRNIHANQIFLRRFRVDMTEAGDARPAMDNEVHIYQFKNSWPGNSDEYSNNEDIITIWVKFIELFTSVNANNSMIVHCYNGATRSGLFVAAWIACQKISYDRFVIPYLVVKSLKETRPQIVDDLNQYKFIFKLLFKWIKHTMSNQIDKLKQDGNIDEYFGIDGNYHESLYTSSQNSILPAKTMSKLAETGNYESVKKLNPVHYSYDNNIA